MSPVEWIILAVTAGPSLLTLIRGVLGQKKLTRAQLIQTGRTLAWEAVEGVKKLKPDFAISVDAMTAMALDEFEAWAPCVGLKLTPTELAISRRWWEIKSKADKAYVDLQAKKKRSTTAK